MKLNKKKGDCVVVYVWSLPPWGKLNNFESWRGRGMCGEIQSRITVSGRCQLYFLNMEKMKSVYEYVFLLTLSYLTPK